MYRPIDARFWTDPKIRELNLADRHTFLYLLTNPHTNMLGLYLLPLPYMADDLQQPLNTCRTAVKRLSNANLIIYDQANRMMFVNHFLKYNTVAGNKREMGAVNKLQELPPTFLLANLLDAVIQYQPKLQLLTEALELVTKNDQRIPDQRAINGRSTDVELQEQEQIQDKEQDKDKEETATNQVIDYLNEKANTRFQHSLSSQKHIRARLQAGATVEDCRLIIDHKLKWLHDEEMAEYLRPATLFRPSHFEGYLAAAIRWDQNGRKRTKKEKLARNKAIAKAGSALYDKQHNGVPPEMIEETPGDGDGNS